MKLLQFLNVLAFRTYIEVYKMKQGNLRIDDEAELVFMGEYRGQENLPFQKRSTIKLIRQLNNKIIILYYDKVGK